MPEKLRDEFRKYEIKYDFILSPDIRVLIEWLKKNTLAFECERKVKELLNE